MSKVKLIAVIMSICASTKLFGSDTSQVTFGEAFGPYFYSDEWRAFGGIDVTYVRDPKWRYGISVEYQRYPGGGYLFEVEELVIPLKIKRNVWEVVFRGPGILFKPVFMHAGIGVAPGFRHVRGGKLTNFYVRLLPLIGTSWHIWKSNIVIEFDFAQNYNLWYDWEHNRDFSLLGILSFKLLDKGGVHEERISK